MLGRTHFFVGTAVSLAVLHPQSMSSLVAGAGAAAIGSMISDVDSGTSQAHQEADKIMAAVIAVSAVVIILDYKFHVGNLQPSHEGQQHRKTSDRSAWIPGDLSLWPGYTASVIYAFFSWSSYAHGVCGCDLSRCCTLFCSGIFISSGTGSSEPEICEIILALEKGILYGNMFLSRLD